MFLNMQTRQPFLQFLCLFANVTVKSYKSSALLVNVKTCTSVNVCFFKRVREYYDANVGFVLLSSSDWTTHRAVLPKHTYSYSTETSASLSHWITVISWSSSQQNFYSARTIILRIKQNKLRTHAHTQYFSLQCSHSCYRFCFASTCSIRCVHQILLGCCKIWVCALVVFIFAWTLVVVFSLCECDCACLHVHTVGHCFPVCVYVHSALVSSSSDG